MEKTIYKTREESHKAYKEYVDEHISNVKKALDMFGHEIASLILVLYYNIETIYEDQLNDALLSVRRRVQTHDNSKYSNSEFEQYAAKFYSCYDDIANKEEVDKNFENAWIHHYFNNDHHPEFWKVNIQGYVYNTEMTPGAIIEMILDWISVSMTMHTSVYDWWINGAREEKKSLMATKTFVVTDKIIEKMKDKLDFSK